MYYTNMITNNDVQNLANLARIDVSENEIDGVRKKMESVLDYVSEVQSLTDSSVSDIPTVGENRNVFRDDENAHDSEKYTKNIINNVPEKEGNYVKVRKIL